MQDKHLCIQTLTSRIAAIVSSVRSSRRKFEAEPDRGFFGKSLTRVFNVYG